MVPLGPTIPNKILQPITGYYFLDSPEKGENQKVPGQVHIMDKRLPSKKNIFNSLNPNRIRETKDFAQMSARFQV